MTNFNFSKQLKIVVFSKQEIEKEELDNEEDLKDFVLEKAKVIKEYKEVISGWSIDSKFYVMVIKT
ncbi:hypothetical protein A3A46_03695 [Candidatus Roizmanbacteria bacterium RIFCSPLOWO2_01_FULL_37_13]|uniref:Uncharacterized protein n=1 Tax=Candidatus Roizmanbacteria bacterium RIFCSPHIGHO2_02_FULL_38_11 TaxID=1802039 RepID=A0A1F7H1H9_9BACT|nr:MAG: hypothetical protein A3C25_00480 [Candidatus Roizmanbacteria bacterium RIFCSPHIGHO2_02_FULL_38_11]OGK34238.1 MAG: hypothetical protein A3F58_01430 [Candidatus Roizmanbacteria bacterium RIFCSPHIGHO2_12_FULL_37_9b]OGK41026.1 MAG: hypothetical protein A3A46_03695 [Candidatus Roizmanbacteria bacterium RIFCSPLOWO2_01_FULL_37_13]